jgi:zinc ribbon protein
MKCAACNTENPPNAKFCLSCGAALVVPQPVPPPGAVQQGKSAGLRITPTAIGIVVLLLISAVGAAYVGWSWYEDSTRPGETASVDERAIEEKRRKAEQDRLEEERQKAGEAEREKQRQQADAEQAMRLAREKVDEDRKRADTAARAPDEGAKRAEAKAREEERARQQARAQQEAKAQQEARAREEAKARDEAKAREQARAREEARARELARQREAQAREARARQAAASSTTRPADTQAYTPAPAPAPVQPAPVVAQAPVAAAPAQNEPCAGLSGLKREQCTSCNRHTGLRKSACEDRALDRYCEGKWNRPGQPECVDPRKR